MLAGSKLKVARAKQHLHELDVLVQRYFAAQPFSHYESRDPQTGEDVIHLVVASNPPRIASAIAGDALQNLRSALDLMVCDLIRANNNFPSANSGFRSSTDRAKAQSKNKLDCASIIDYLLLGLLRYESSPRFICRSSL